MAIFQKSTGTRLKKRKGKKSNGYFIPSDLPDLGCSPIQGAWAGFRLMSVLGWGPGSWVMTKKILIVMSDPMIFAPLGTTTKTGKQANYRSTWMETKNGAHVHNAIFPTMNKYSLFMNNAKYSFRKERRENHPKWSKGDKDRQVSYGITSRYKLKMGTNELTA